MIGTARPWLSALALASLCVGTRPAAAAPVEFNRDVRPILADTCFQCHGPDKAQRKAALRLDTEEGAAKILGRDDPTRSELVRRITATDDAERMPPPKSGRALTPAQIDTLKRWVADGAKWQRHWSFLPPARPLLPGVRSRDWPRNGIDHFILARLEREGLAPSPEADRTTLLRRVTLDLTGLPPTPAEVDAFLADASPDGYEKAVDRLLASPRYGEKMAARWLDAARYADTNGYQSDGERFMWRWRDWVIDALNANMPFDRFTVEQLAGDLLPGATLDQKIATGFNRNHRGNGEGGIIPEEYAVEYVVDRVETTATVWLGLTLGCCRCHDHKFDPLSQKEFYRVFAYFNNVSEQGRAVKYGNSMPYIPAPTRRQQEQLAALDRRLAAARQRFDELAGELAAAEVKWERSLPTAPPQNWSPRRGLVAQFPLDGKEGAFDGRRSFDAGDVGDFGFYDKFSLAARVRPADRRGGTIISRMADAARAEGYAIGLHDGRVFVHLTKRWLDDALRVETERALPAGEWHHVLVTYDGSRVAAGVRVYIDGRPERVKVLLDELNQSFATKEPLRIGAGGGPDERFRGTIGEVRVYDICLEPDEAGWLATPQTVSEIAALLREKRTPQQAGKLRACFLEQYAPEAIRQAHRDLVELRRRREAMVENFPTVMVMEEMPVPRPTFVLTRGQYDKPGEKVTPGVPAILPPLSPRGRGAGGEGSPSNRLDFARWLVRRSNPLTARVTVNRYWQTYFGTGLVKTVDDFGVQGEWPSHPELLDWLAVEFMASGWDVKAMQRLIVTSATYRQSSRVTPALLAKDPDNRLLARGPRFRLPAEAVRDQALAASGLLVERVGGPSVKPYQPPGLWKELTGTEEYVPDHGDRLYRRSLYTFWKRTAAPPALVTFDAAGRETCVVRQTRTNTPLQALNLMNDVTFVEASRVLAQRAMREGGSMPQERVTLMFRLATGRMPRPAELGVLLDGYRRHLADYQKDREAARKLTTIGEAPRDAKLGVSELAAYTTLAGVILNLDEVVTKE
jgi:mono/diheme cytochrome c family protein